MQDLEKELLEVQQSMQESQARREVLDQELEKINKTLRDAKDSRRKSKDEERLLQAIAALKRHFPGVQGRLVDLCRPTQRRFNMAITVAAGKDMDAIVVDTKETAVECIRHLREQRVGTATFLPLDNLQVPSDESQERVRAQVSKDSRFRLAADCITCEDAIKPAVLYAVGNTVVCDDLDSAREICFGNAHGGGSQQARFKAVTLGGAVISKAGTMTGGVTREDGNKAGRWGAAEIEKLREKKERLENERSELDSTNQGGGRGSRRGPSFGGRGGRAEELRNNLNSLKSKNHYTKSDLNYTEKTLREKQIQLKSLAKQVEKLEKDQGKVETSITKLTKDVKQAQAAVKNAEEEHLGPFREKTGLKDFDAYEDAIGDRKKEFREEKQKLMEHIAKLEQKRDYETNRDFQKPLANLEKRIEDNKSKLEKTTKKKAKLEKKVEEAKAQLAEAEEEVKEAGEAEKSHEEEVEAAQAEYAESQKERNKASKAVNNGTAALERLRGTLTKPCSEPESKR